MSRRLDAANSVVKRTGIPEGWREVAVCDLADIVGGGTPDRDQSTYWRDGTIPWITPTDLTANGLKFISQGAEAISEFGLEGSNATLVPANSLIFSTRGTVGSMALAANPLACNQSCETLVPRPEEVDPEFLYYLLNFGLSAFIRLSGGTTFGAVTPRDIARVKFAVPRELEEQTGIAQILSAVDVALEHTSTAVLRARALRQALLADLLTSGMKSDGTVRNRQADSTGFVSTQIGTLPSSWRLSSVKSEFDVQNGITLNASRRRGFNHRQYLRVANVKRDALDLSDIQQLDAADDEFLPRRLAKDDLLVVEGHANRMQIGRCALVTPEAVGMTFQNHLFRLRTKGEVLPGFGCLWLNSSYALRYWNARCATSSGLNTINQRTLARLTVPVPPRDEQEMIVQLAAQQRSYMVSLVGSKTAMQELKKALMHDLFTGRVRVRKAAELIAS